MDNYDGPLTSQDLQDLAYSLGQNSADEEKMQNLYKQMQLAQQLRGVGASIPRGQHIPGFMGGVYVAPNALQDIGAAAGDVMSYRQGKNALGQANDIADDQQAARTKMLAAILRSRMGGAQQDPQMESFDPSKINPGSIPQFNVDDPYSDPRLQYINPGA